MLDIGSEMISTGDGKDTIHLGTVVGKSNWAMNNHDTVFDFSEYDDTLIMEDTTQINDWTDLWNATSFNSQGDAVIEIYGLGALSTITLNGIDASDLALMQSLNNVDFV